MTINIDGYEIEIKARYTEYGANHNVRFNKRDTMAVINSISIWASEAKERYEQVGCNALARLAYKVHNDLYDQLERNKYFKYFEE